MYDPKPMDTGGVALPEELLALTEQIAENVHDVWAAGRIAEGWTYGQTRDTEKKTTPLLVPYGELPESEKQYDRNTALETIRLILKMGYRIEREAPVGGPDHSQESGECPCAADTCSAPTETT